MLVCSAWYLVLKLIVTYNCAVFRFPLPCVGDQAAMTEAMLAVGSASQLEFCTRAAGVEVLLSLAERAPAIMRKCPSLAPGLLPLALALTCEVSSGTDV